MAAPPKNVRRWAPAVLIAGVLMWLASMLAPLVLRESHVWTEEQSRAYEQASHRLHDLIEQSHSHRLGGGDEAADRDHDHEHATVDPQELAEARAEFERQSAELADSRAGNRRRLGWLFWGGIALTIVGGVTFMATNESG